MCQPHYDETVNIGNLLGVVCADVTLAMLQDVGADRDVSSNVNWISSLVPTAVDHFSLALKFFLKCQISHINYTLSQVAFPYTC